MIFIYIFCHAGRTIHEGDSSPYFSSPTLNGEQKCENLSFYYLTASVKTQNILLKHFECENSQTPAGLPAARFALDPCFPWPQPLDVELV